MGVKNKKPAYLPRHILGIWSKVVHHTRLKVVYKTFCARF